jgi:hypothetical protein
MPDESLEILIKTAADTSGATQAAASLGKTAEAAKGLQVTFDKAKGATEELTDKSKKLAPTQDETTKSAQGMGEAHRELHRLMHQVTEESPILGLAMRAAFSPVGAAIMAASLAIRFAAQAEAESLARARGAAEEAARGFGGMAGPMRAATDAAAESQVAFDEWSAHLGKDCEHVTGELENVIAQMRAAVGAQKELIGAQKGAALAGLELEKATGKVTPEQYEARKTAIEGAARRATGELDRDAEQSEIAAREKTLAETRKRADAAKAAAAALAAREQAPDTKMAEAAAARLRKQSEEAAGRASEAQGKMPAAQEAAAEARVKASTFLGKYGPTAIGEAMTGFAKVPFGGDVPLAPVQQARKADEDVAKLAKARDEEAKLSAKSAEEASRITAARAAEKRELADAEKKASELTASANSQAGTLERLKGEAAARETYRPATEAAEESAEKSKLLTNLGKTPIGAAAETDVSAAAATASALQNHKQVSNESKEQLMEIASAVAGHQVSLQQAVNVMGQAGKDMGAFVSDVMRLADLMSQTVGSNAQLASKLYAISQEVEALHVKIANIHN